MGVLAECMALATAHKLIVQQALPSVPSSCACTWSLQAM